MLFSNGTKMPALKTLSLMVFSGLFLTACSSDDDDSGEGYYLIYNGSSNAPELTFTFETDDDDDDEVTYSGLASGKAAGLLTMDTGKYEVTFTIDVSNDDEQDIYNDEQRITGDDVTFTVLAGDIQSPEVLTYSYEYEDPDTDDEEFTLRFLNLNESSEGIDVYMSLEDETFDEATLVDSLNFTQFSDSHYFEVESYKFYLTYQGSDEVVFESDDIDFLYTNQQLIVLKADNGPSSSPFMIDKITSSGSVTEYSNIDSEAKVQFYNAMDDNVLLPEYTDETFDIHLGGISEAPFASLERRTNSEHVTVESNDYSIDITAVGGVQKLTNSQILSMDSNDDKTVFYYLTEVTEEDDDDDDTEEETELFVNTLITDNNNQIGTYHHEIKVVNFVEDHASVSVYFVGPGESLSSTDNVVTNIRGTASEIDLKNDDYSVYVLAQEDSSEILLSITSLDLDEESGNLYLVIEQEDEDVDIFTTTVFSQN